MNSSSKITGTNPNSVESNTEDINDNVQDSEQGAYSWRFAVQQVMMLFGGNLHSLSVGIALAFPTVVIAQLHEFNGIWTLKGEKYKIYVKNKEENEITYDDDLASWHGSLAMTSVLLGSLVASAVQPRFGRRIVLNIANIFLVTAWSLSSVAQQPALILASSALTSFYAGSLVAPNLVYQNENLLPRFLGNILVLPVNHISLMLGMVIEMGLGAVIYWRTIAAINAIFPGICILIVFILPENTSSLKQNKKSTHPCQSNTENKASHYSLRDEIDSKVKANNLTAINRRSTTQPSLRMSPNFHAAALLTASLCYLHLCGVTVIRTYSTPLLGILSAYGFPDFICSFPFILSCTQISGVCFGLALRDWSERSCKMPLLLASYVGSIGSCLALGFYSHFHVHKSTIPQPNVKITSAIPAWLPSVLLGIHSFASYMSIPLVPHSFAGEFFPSFSLRLTNRCALFLSSIICFLGNKFFFSLVHIVGVRGFFWIYSLTGFLCSGLICTLIPHKMNDDGHLPAKRSRQYIGEDLFDTPIDSSSVSIREEKSQRPIHSYQDNERKFSHQSSYNSAEFKSERRITIREMPEWLGDISWAGRHGGWLVEEKRKGGWRVVERGYRHENGGGRSMEVEPGTWIGHMIQTVTKAAITEESKDFARWKLANRTKKRWIITRGPNNQWQICSAPWETDTSDESEDSHESDDTDSSNGTKSNPESSYSDDMSSNGKNEVGQNELVHSNVPENCSSENSSENGKLKINTDHSYINKKNYEAGNSSHYRSKKHKALQNRSHSLSII